MSKKRPLKRVWAYEDTLHDLKSKAAKEGLFLKDYLDKLNRIEIPRENEKRYRFKFP